MFLCRSTLKHVITISFAIRCYCKSQKFSFVSRAHTNWSVWCFFFAYPALKVKKTTGGSVRNLINAAESKKKKRWPKGSSISTFDELRQTISWNSESFIFNRTENWVLKKMPYDKVKLTKPDNKQLGRKAVRTLQLNLRFCIFISLFLITVILIVRANRKLQDQPKHLSLNQYIRNFFHDPYEVPLKNDSIANEPDYVWSEEIIQLFQDQLGIVIESDGEAVKVERCRVGKDFVVTALPGVVDNDLGDVLWQYLSLIALESQTIEFDDDGGKLTLKAFVTEQMRAKMDQLFEGWNWNCYLVPARRLSLPIIFYSLPLRMLSNLPSTCYSLKYAQIIGNKSPIILRKISHLDSPLLLDPKAKRVKEIAQLFGSKMRPFLR